MSSVPDYFDVLSIDEKNEKVDIIQSLIGTDCLGTYFENGQIDGEIKACKPTSPILLS